MKTRWKCQTGNSSVSRVASQTRLAFGAVAVAARVLDVLMRSVCAARKTSAKRRPAPALDCRHLFQLYRAEMIRVFSMPSATIPNLHSNCAFWPETPWHRHYVHFVRKHGEMPARHAHLMQPFLQDLPLVKVRMKMSVCGHPVLLGTGAGGYLLDLRSFLCLPAALTYAA